MKRDFSTIVLVLVFLLGLSVLLYPTISDYWNSKTQTRAIIDYEAMMAKMKPEDFTTYFKEAEEFNERLRTMSYPLMNHKELEDYHSILAIGGKSIMGYVTIPKIKVELPIYHGTSNAVLNTAAGHLEGSSFPIGGEGTHAVVTAHRGLPSSKLFTNLDKLEVGDTFSFTVLNRKVTYQVEKISIVEPDKVASLVIEEGKDRATLFTCTPYGINTHRLLVHGIRTDNLEEKDELYIAPEAYRVDPIIVMPFVAAPMLLVLLIVLLVKYRKKK